MGLLMGFGGAVSRGYGQTVPFNYWKFDDQSSGTTWKANSIAPTNLLLYTGSNAPTPTGGTSSSNGATVSYLHLDNEYCPLKSTLAPPSNLTPGSATATTAALEFFIHPDELTHNIMFVTNYLYVTWSFDGFSVETRYHPASNCSNTQTLTCDFPFTGVNRASSEYYLNSWHHVAVNVDLAPSGASGAHIELWVDGQKVSYNDNTVLPCSTNTFSIVPSGSVDLNINYSSAPSLYFSGGVDEVAMYNVLLPSGLICKHSTDGLSSHSNYATTGSCTPLSDNLVGEIDPNEFPPLSYLQANNPNDGMVKQLQTFPLPRFKPNVYLERNINMLDVDYRRASVDPSENAITGPHKAEVTSNMANLNLELSEKWNYYLSLPGIPNAAYNSGSPGTAYTNLADVTTYVGKMIDQAITYSWLPTHLGENWAFVINGNVAKTSGTLITDPSYSYYLYTNNCGGSPSLYSPTTFSPRGVGLVGGNPRHDKFQDDGASMRARLDGYIDESGLNRMINLVTENGELGTIKPLLNSANLTNDPCVYAACSTIYGATPTAENWYAYDTKYRFKPFVNSYSFGLLDASSSPAISSSVIDYAGSGVAGDTKYTYYQIGSDWLGYRPQYSEGRQVMSKFTSSDNSYTGYYHTNNFYPYYPKNWYLSSLGKLTGLGRMRKAIDDALAAGDKFCSPYVAASPYDYIGSPYTSWCAFASPNENKLDEIAFRPAQWLGQLKYNTILGAEFYHAFYYHDNVPGDACPVILEHANNYIWQATTPSYVQGIVTRFEEVFKDGDVVEGTLYTNSIYTTTSSDVTLNSKYTLDAHDNRILVGARKLNDKYVISGNINPSGNTFEDLDSDGIVDSGEDYNAPLTAEVYDVEIDPGFSPLDFNVRRQGSMYYYERDADVANPANSEAVFYQLDGWHEYSHPYYWSKDFILEAELFDNASLPFGAGLKTKTGASQAACNTLATNGTTDYRFYDTYVTFTNPHPVLEYNFAPRETGNHYVYVRARRTGATGKSSINVDITIGSGSTNTYVIGCITSTSWDWYRVNTGSVGSPSALTIAAGTADENIKLEISTNDTDIEIDQIFVPQTSSSNLSYATGTCTTCTTPYVGTSIFPRVGAIGVTVYPTVQDKISVAWQMPCSSVTTGDIDNIAGGGGCLITITDLTASGNPVYTHSLVTNSNTTCTTYINWTATITSPTYGGGGSVFVSGHLYKLEIKGIYPAAVTDCIISISGKEYFIFDNPTTSSTCGGTYDDSPNTTSMSNNSCTNATNINAAFSSNIATIYATMDYPSTSIDRDFFKFSLNGATDKAVKATLRSPYVSGSTVLNYNMTLYSNSCPTLVPVGYSVNGSIANTTTSTDYIQINLPAGFTTGDYYVEVVPVNNSTKHATLCYELTVEKVGSQVVRISGENNDETTENDDLEQAQNLSSAIKAYPNPFTHIVNFELNLAESEVVSLEIYDVLGKKVADITKNTYFEAGSHSLAWDSKGEATGVYFYQLHLNDKTTSGKVVKSE